MGNIRLVPYPKLVGLASPIRLPGNPFRLAGIPHPLGARVSEMVHWSWTVCFHSRSLVKLI